MIRCSEGRRRNGLSRRFRAAALGVVWSTALAVASGLPVVAAEVKIDRREGVPTDASRVRADLGWESLRRGAAAIVADQTAETVTPERAPGKTGTFERIGTTDSDAAMVRNGGNPRAEPNFEHEGSIGGDPAAGLLLGHAAAETGVKQLLKERAWDDVTKGQMVQFELPQPTPEGETPALPQRLTYQYSFGSESEITYRRDQDLSRRLRDDSLVLLPNINGYITYRPTDWLETTLEVLFEKEIPVIEQGITTLPGGEEIITLPGGGTALAPEREFSLLVDQAYVTIKGFTAPFEFSVGRINFEDERHWLFDSSIDVASVSFRQSPFQAQASVGREVLIDLDLLQQQQKDQINTYMFYADYRGIEDIRFAGYTVFRDDRAGLEGRPLLLGLRTMGRPSESFSYWTELAYLAGSDEALQKFSAYAFDVGGTYRFTGLPLYPNITLGFAFATGDGNPDDGRNTEFRQTGLQSNETRFAGVSDFKVYGEALDPELSNLKILTVSFGFQPAPDTSVDFVYHRYWLDDLSDEIRNSPITAIMNETSTDVGSGFDFVLGLRNLFGVRRLGLDLRTGWFFPGKAFRTTERNGENVTFRDPDPAVAVVAKLWWR